MLSSIGKFYFFRQFNAREGSLCQTGSVTPKTKISKVKIVSSQFSPLSLRNMLFLNEYHKVPYFDRCSDMY